MKKYLILLIFGIVQTANLFAADIPQHISYTQIYDFVDELANDGIIEIKSVVKPYSRELIAKKLLEAKERANELSVRQQKELDFYLNDFALETGQMPPKAKVNIVKKNRLSIALLQPAIQYRDTLFRARLTPILGAEFSHNGKNFIAGRTFGADFQGSVGKYFSVWGSIRDMAFRDELLSQPTYLNMLPGYQYKEVSGGGADYSDSRGGIRFANRWLSLGLVKDHIIWGDNYHGSTILSGRAPSFPMVTLQVTPAKWFQLDYFHGWLVSNVVDSTNYYLIEGENPKYRPANKFIAANMLTFTPIKKLNISIGNSIIYSEQNVQAAYFIPIAFYKSLDHALTKGSRLENQNSQMHINISSRNIKHLHLYGSIFADEIQFARFKAKNKETNPLSYKIGAKLSNFPIKNLSLLAEYTRSEIITYKHSIPQLLWASNSYNLGHYLGDNAQEIYVELKYKPVRGLDLALSYLYAEHGNEYAYDRQNILNIISQDFMQDKVWTNSTIGFRAIYEIVNNIYLGLNLQYSHIKGHDAKTPSIDGETRLNAQGYLDLYTPKFLQGRKLFMNMSLNIGF